MLDVLSVEESAKQPVSITGAVICKDTADDDAEASVMRTGHEEEAHCRLMALIGQDGREADAAMVVDRHMQILPADAAGLLATISGDAMARLADPRQTLDIEVNQI